MLWQDRIKNKKDAMRIYYFCILACIALKGMEPLRLRVARQGQPPMDPHEYIRKLIKSNNAPEAQKSKVEFKQKINPRFISISLIHEAMRVKDLWYLTIIANTLAEFTKKNLNLYFRTNSNKITCAVRLAPYLKKRIQHVKEQHPDIRTKLKEGSLTLRFNPTKELIYFYNSESRYGFLHAATCFDNIGLMETVLTKYKLDANDRDMDGRTPLFFVKSRAAVQLLCRHKAALYQPEEKTYIVDKNGKSPLHFIAQQGELEGVRCYPETVNELIAHGASISLRDNRGKTPLECAQEVLEYFYEAGCVQVDRSQKVREAYNYIQAEPTTYIHIAKELMRIAEESRETIGIYQHASKESRLQKRMEYVKNSLAELAINDNKKKKWKDIFTLIYEEEKCPLTSEKAITDYFKARKSDDIQETNTYTENIERIIKRQNAIIERLQIASDSYLS